MPTFSTLKQLTPTTIPETAEEHSNPQNAQAQGTSNKSSSCLKIAVPSLTTVLYASVNEILRCASEESYTRIYFENRPPVLSTKSLKEYHKHLEECGFYRIHRSHLINLEKVIAYHKGASDAVEFSNGSQITVARRRRADFLQVMKDRCLG